MPGARSLFGLSDVAAGPKALVSPRSPLQQVGWEADLLDKGQQPHGIPAHAKRGLQLLGYYNSPPKNFWSTFVYNSLDFYLGKVLLKNKNVHDNSFFFFSIRQVINYEVFLNCSFWFLLPETTCVCTPGYLNVIYVCVCLHTNQSTLHFLKLKFLFILI